MAIENTFKFLTDIGLEQYDAIIKEYMNANYAKKGESGSSFRVTADVVKEGSTGTLTNLSEEPETIWQKANDGESIELELKVPEGEDYSNYILPLLAYTEYDNHKILAFGFMIDEKSFNAGFIFNDGSWRSIYEESKTPYMKETSWSELKSDRDSGKLIPGMQYRITDYECTTSQANTQSVGHSFDIIVTADSEDTLNENARAICRDNDSYFDNSNLEAWEIKYCLDNDTNRFSWADENNGHGVIYYMKDEHNNECPYDFKNIQYYVNNTWKYTFDNNGYDDSLNWYCNNNVIKEYYSENKFALNFITLDDNCNNNVFDINCHNINIPNNCSNNTFGNSCYDINIGVKSTNNTFGNSCYDINAGNTFYNNILQNGCRSLAFSQGGPLLDYVMNCIVYLGTGSGENTLLVPVTTYSIIPQFVCNKADHVYVWTPFNN